MRNVKVLNSGYFDYLELQILHKLCVSYMTIILIEFLCMISDDYLYDIDFRCADKGKLN